MRCAVNPRDPGVAGLRSNKRVYMATEAGRSDNCSWAYRLGVVNDANGNWICNDDANGLNPAVEINNPAAGQYDIWVGSYSSGTFVAGTLAVSEIGTSSAAPAPLAAAQNFPMIWLGKFGLIEKY